MRNETNFAGAKRARLIMMFFALLAALAALQALSAKPAVAGPTLIGSGGSSWEINCPFVTYGLTSPPAMTWTGTDANDTKCGGNYSDSLNGLGGSDHLFGVGGPDMLYGGTGEDELGGEAGDDTISPGDGEDYVSGSSGNDTINASADGKRDILHGGDGFDVVRYVPECGSGVPDDWRSIESATRIGSC
jgi:Ca2+-binding RTX toxin-like protein